MVKKEHKKDVAEKESLTATQQIMNDTSKSIKSKIPDIIDQVNRLYNTALKPRIVRCRIQLGLENILPRSGYEGLSPVPIEAALVDGVSSFVGLACAKQKKTPTSRSELIDMI